MVENAKWGGGWVEINGKSKVKGELWRGGGSCSPHTSRAKDARHMWATCFGIEAKVKAQIRHEQKQGQEQRQGDLIALPTQVAHKTRDICGPPALVSRRGERHK